MRRGTKYFCGICVIIAIFAVSNYIFINQHSAF